MMTNSNQQGFSLIELLVAMLLSLVLVLACSGVYS
jgi:prepilin-type N-terminal cleavage/methylation domain-containing protein